MTGARAPRGVRFRVSPVHGLYRHVRQLAVQPAAVAGEAGRLAVFRSLTGCGQVSGDDDGHAGARPLASRDRQCGVAAAHAANLADWQQALLAHHGMPAADAAHLTDLLTGFQGAYEQQIGPHCRRRLRAWQRLLDNATASPDWESLLGTIAAFYRHRWRPPTPAFVVSLHLAPEGEPCRATVEDDVVTLHLPGAARDAPRYLGVVAHEICHVFDDDGARPDGAGASEPRVPPAGLSRAAFVYGRLALHEALATAIGNGWVVKRLAGTLPPAPWYDDWHVAAFAGAIYPLVDAALSNGRRIDADFVEQAVRIYCRVVGQRMWEPQHLFAHLAVLIDERLAGTAPEDLAQALGVHFECLSDVEQIDGTEAAQLDRLAAADATRLVVLSCHNAAGWLRLQSRLGWLRGLPARSDRPFVAALIGADEPATCVIGLSAWSELDAALARLKRGRADARGVQVFGLDDD